MRPELRPALYSADTTAISNYGYGILTDALECKVSCEENGAYDLSMIYPVIGVHFEDLVEDRLISARPSSYEGMQLFRIYRISRPYDGRVQVYAHHLSYDLNNCIVKPFSAKKLSAAITQLKKSIIGDCPFEISAAYDKEASFSVAKPMTLRAAILGNTNGNLAETYGGIWSFDGLTCVLREKTEVNRGVRIAYGRNLLDVTQEKNIEEMYTHVFPYWSSEKSKKFYSIDPIEILPGATRKKIYPLDLSSYYEKSPSDASMKKTAAEFIAKNDMAKPTVSITAKWVQLEKCVEYSGAADAEKVLRGDTVEVRFLRLGISATARVTKTDYDVLKDQYEDVSLGDAKQTLARTIVRQQSQITTSNDRATDASRVATDYIEKTEGGAVNFGTGGYKYTINNDGLQFSGIRNTVALWTNGKPSDGMAKNTTVTIDLSSYAAIAVGFIDNLGGIFDSGTLDNNSVQWTIAVVDEHRTVRATYTWDYPRVRDFVVKKTGITFGAGGWLSSSEISLPDGSKIPLGAKLHENKACCIPSIIIGFL